VSKPATIPRKQALPLSRDNAENTPQALAKDLIPSFLHESERHRRNAQFVPIQHNRVHYFIDFPTNSLSSQAIHLKFEEISAKAAGVR
jgi:hypothetical protein